jgi:hypothetical protein
MLISLCAFPHRLFTSLSLQCMVMRGVSKTQSKTVTSTMLGVFRDDPKTREEFLNLVHSKWGATKKDAYLVQKINDALMMTVYTSLACCWIFHSFINLTQNFWIERISYFTKKNCGLPNTARSEILCKFSFILMPIWTFNFNIFCA